jgi:hypothetical protein
MPYTSVFKIAQRQHRFPPHASHKRHGLPIRADLWTASAAINLDNVADFVGLQIEPTNDKDSAVGVFVVFKVVSPRHVFCPIQILVVPVIIAVGNGLTVTAAEPLPVLLQLFASLTLDMTYVLVEAGLTEIVLGELVILFIVTGVVPSV